jgi:hypothetical protein
MHDQGAQVSDLAAVNLRQVRVKQWLRVRACGLQLGLELRFASLKRPQIVQKRAWRIILVQKQVEDAPDALCGSRKLLLKSGAVGALHVPAPVYFLMNGSFALIRLRIRSKSESLVAWSSEAGQGP